jgi:hypothetical protein
MGLDVAAGGFDHHLLHSLKGKQVPNSGDLTIITRVITEP